MKRAGKYALTKFSIDLEVIHVRASLKISYNKPSKCINVRIVFFFWHTPFVITPTCFDLLSVSDWNGVCVMFEFSLVFCYRSDWARWDRGLIRGWGRIFFCTATSRLVVGPSAACCSLGTDTVSLAVKWPGCETDYVLGSISHQTTAHHDFRL
jgi:hypothetical protein